MPDSFLDKYKPGICPYCRSELLNDVLVCKDCGNNLAVFHDILKIISSERLELKKELERELPQSKFSLSTGLVFVAFGVVACLLLLHLQIDGHQSFVWMFGLLYAYLSIEYFNNRSVWATLLFPLIIPALSYLIVKRIPAVAPEFFEPLTDNLVTTTIYVVFLNVFFSLVILWRKRMLSFRDFFSGNTVVKSLIGQASHVENIQRIIFAALCIGSVASFVIKFLE